MAVPKKINTIKRGDARYYVHPITGKKAIGVTSVLNMLPKGFLGPWNAKSVATAAMDMLPELVALALKGQQQAAIDMLKRTTYRDVGEAARQGTEAHGFMDSVLNGRKIARQHPDVEAFINRVRDFVELVQPEVLYTEEAIWNQEFNYSGRFDGILRFSTEALARAGVPITDNPPDTFTSMFDGKTTRSGVHAEVALQLKAYSKSPIILLEGGIEVPMPTIDNGMVFHFRPDGWQLVPVVLDGPEGDELWKVFTALLTVARDWETGEPGEPSPKDAVLGMPLLTRTEDGLLLGPNGKEVA
jgi:hypothetical protein